MTAFDRSRCFFAAVFWITGAAGIGTAKADDVQVNTYTTNGQGRPSVSVDADGDYVVVWMSTGSGGTDSSSTSVQGQRYASDGSSAGGQFQVNTYTTSTQRYPSVSVDADGDFVVVWYSIGSGGTDTSNHSVQGQRYASDGSSLGGEFQVNTYTTNGQVDPSVSVDADGDFVVVWESDGSGGTDSSSLSVQAQRYAADGLSVGDQFQVNTYTTGNQQNPSVSVKADGDFVVVWQSTGSGGTDSSGYSIQGQRYASDGSTVGDQFQVNTYTTSAQWFPSVSVDAAGDFVVVWESVGSGGTDTLSFSVQGQRYASDGSSVGDQFQVNTYIPSYQRCPSVSVDADGDFVVVWQSFGSGGTDSSLYSVQGQRYASDGSSVGGELQINTYTTSSQFRPSVSVDAAGDFVVVWQSYGSGGTDSDGGSIQRWDLRLFADGFENGDTSSWSSTTAP